MSTPRTPPAELVANLEFRVAGQRIPVALPAPNRPVSPEALLPAYRILADAIEKAAVSTVKNDGLAISCRAGCGACCRQLVPIAEVEARFLAKYVAALPEPQRDAVRTRFADALARLDHAGLLDTLRHPADVPDEDRPDLGLSYFHLGIPCPFLVDESCSIHAIRPLVCREYLVTSPAANCAHPTPESIQRVEIPVRLSGALARVGDDVGTPRTTWVPLVLALEWAERYPDDLPERPGPEWLLSLLKKLGGDHLPPPSNMG